MGLTLKILPESELCLIYSAGRASAAEHERFASLLEQTKRERADFDELSIIGPDRDYSEITHRLTTDLAQQFVDQHEPGSRPSLRRCAFVCANEVQFAVMRLFLAHVDIKGATNLETMCFLQLNEAMDWIESNRGKGCRIDRDQVDRLLREIGQGWCAVDTATPQNGNAAARRT